MRQSTDPDGIDEIEDQFDRLRDDLSELSDVIRKVAQSKSTEAGDAALAEAQRLLERSRKTLDDGAARARRAAKSLEDYIHEKPVQASLIALGIGLFIGLLSRR